MGLCLLAFALLLGAVIYRLDTRSQSRARYTEADVHEVVIPGVTRRSEILVRFGEPIFVEAHPKTKMASPEKTKYSISRLIRRPKP
jgi:hypothetical protein